MRSSYPKTVDILGRDVAVQFVANITVADEVGNYSRKYGIAVEHADDEDSTFLHEILHAIIDRAGYSELLGDKAEEALVTCLEHALDGIVRINWTSKKFKY